MDLDFLINGGWIVQSEVTNKETGEIANKNVFVGNILQRIGVKNPTSAINVNALKFLKQEIMTYIESMPRNEQQLIQQSEEKKEEFEKDKEPIIIKKVKDGRSRRKVDGTNK